MRRKAKINIDPVDLEKKWRAGFSAVQLAEMYDCNISKIYKTIREHKLPIVLKNSNKEPPPPSQLDERVSQESLMPSPWVRARIAEIQQIR